VFGAEKHKTNSLSCANTRLTSVYVGAFTVNYACLATLSAAPTVG
jgi:hypothetical protein